MHAFAIEPFRYYDREVAAGLHEMTDAEFTSMQLHGPIRPATQDEIQIAGAKATRETASAPPAAEHAARRPAARTKTAAE